MIRLSWRIVAAAALFAALSACQRQGPTIDEGPTAPSTPVPITPISPIAVAPKPSPTPTPTDPPEDPPSDGGGTPTEPGGPISSDPVARVVARVYFVECAGQVVPNSGDATEAAVGCRVHLDVTPKDAQGRPTQAVGTPKWSWSNPAIISASSDSEYTPTFTAVAPGPLAIDCTLDNVQARTIHITLK